MGLRIPCRKMQSSEAKTNQLLLGISKPATLCRVYEKQPATIPSVAVSGLLTWPWLHTVTPPPSISIAILRVIPIGCIMLGFKDPFSGKFAGRLSNFPYQLLCRWNNYLKQFFFLSSKNQSRSAHFYFLFLTGQWLKCFHLTTALSEPKRALSWRKVQGLSSHRSLRNMLF